MKETAPKASKEEDMYSRLSRSILCLTALTVSPAFADPDASGRTESFDFGWKFSRFGTMPDGSITPEPGGAAGSISADSSEKANPAAHAIDGDPATRWCAADAREGHHIILDMGAEVSPQTVSIDWEKKLAHRFLLEGSADGKQWTAIADKRNGSGNETRDTVPATGKHRYYKLTVFGTGNGNWASVRELILADADGKRIAPLVPSEEQAKDPRSPLFNDAAWRTLDLPHDWGIEGPFRMDLPNETGKLPWEGIGWYRKTWNVPADAQGRRFFLDFDGVMSKPQVYVNGQLAGEWKYGYTSFRVDITPFLRYGQPNTVAVRVDNPPESSRWYPGGGIYRHVWLTEAAPVHIGHWGIYLRTPQVSTQQATVDVDTTVANTTEKTVTPVVVQEILKPMPRGNTSSPTQDNIRDATDGLQVVARAESQGQPLAPGKEGIVTGRLTVGNPTLWDTENPHLYTVRTTVKIDGKTVDTRLTPLGIRSIEWRPDGFYLNERRVELKGVCQHSDLGPLGTAVHTRGLERQLEILKQMGANSIRMTHNPPAPELLDLCDRHGILVIDELFDMWRELKKPNDYHRYFNDWHERDLIHLCRRDRNHPSVILWSTGNEVHEQYHRKPQHLETSRRLTELFHREDPTRKVGVGCSIPEAGYNGFGDTFDVLGYNYKPWEYKKFSQKRPNQPFFGSETSSCVSSRGEYFFPVDWDKSKGFFNFQVSSYDLYAPGWANRPDIEFAGQDDSTKVAGEYVWTGFDYLGEPTPYNRDATNALNFSSPTEREAYMKKLQELGHRAPSRSSYFGIVDLCGFPKDRFFLYQARWKPEQPVAHILPHWNWEERKGEPTPVHLYTNGDEAELFLNGQSLGTRKKGKADDDRYRLVWKDVNYQPGELKAVVKKGGKPWAEQTVRTTGEPQKIAMEADRSTISGDGRDLSYLTVTIRDKRGDIVPRSKNDLTFQIDGPADIVGICNGDATDFTTMSNPEKKTTMHIKAYNGMAQVILRSRRNASGQATLTVSSPGLEGAKTDIRITPDNEGRQNR